MFVLMWLFQDTLRDDCDDQTDCVRNCCVHAGIAPIFFVIFVLMAQFVLVNVVVAVLMKHLEESHKQVRTFCLCVLGVQNIKYEDSLCFN